MDLESLFDHHLELPAPGTPLESRMLPPGGGVCALADERGRLILLLAAQNLRRTLGLRLNPPDDGPRRPRADLRALARRLCWIPTFSVFENSLTYLRVARRLNPDRYRKDLAFGPVWFARLDPRQPFPRWVADRFAFLPPLIDVGPFVHRAACRRFIELLEDLFDLCRYHDVLKQAPHAQACAYKDMGRCPAPCDGTVSADRYRDAVLASIEFARGKSDTRLSHLQRAMADAARRLDFENAARFRERLARATRLLADDGRLLPTPDKFRYLVVQRAGGTSRVKPFYVNQGNVRVGQPVKLKDIEQATPAWTDNMWRPPDDTDPPDAACRSECLWAVSHHLIKKDKASGLFLHESQIGNAPELAGKIIGRFRKTPSKSPQDAISIDGDADARLK